VPGKLEVTLNQLVIGLEVQLELCELSRMTTDSNPFSALQSRLMQWQYLGIERFAGGAVKIGRVPHVAPLACLHTIFEPLKEEGLALLQEMLGRPLPVAVADFYRCTNGFKAFSDSICMYGMT